MSVASLVDFCKAEVIRVPQWQVPIAARAVAGCSHLKGKMPLGEAGRVMVGMSAGKIRDRSGQCQPWGWKGIRKGKNL